MNTIKDIYHTQIEVKKSKFLSFLVPINEFERVHKELQAKHPKANHIVWAKRELNEFKQIVENSSDDGEPKGAAGVPTLNVLRGNELINCAILTVRYFGGIKLGVGGMARAYSDAANAVVKEAEILPYVELLSHTIEANYNEQRQIEYNLKELEIEHIEREFLSDRVLYHIKTTKEKLQKLSSL
jgi:uncharacterized YigZ family protein